MFWDQIKKNKETKQNKTKCLPKAITQLKKQSNLQILPQREDSDKSMRYSK